MTALGDLCPHRLGPPLLGLPYAQKVYRLLRYPGTKIYQYEMN